MLIIWIDDGLPSITCPMDFVTNQEPVTWSDPVVSDDIDNVLTVICNPPSGSDTLSEGVNMVMCTATDDAGNEASCMFDVTLGT